LPEFIAGIDKNIPWHVSRFHPDYKFTGLEATPASTLRRAAEIGRSAGLNYIYLGNISGEGEDTLCHSCKKLIIKREGFSILELNMKGNECSFCNAVTPGVFE